MRFAALLFLSVLALPAQQYFPPNVLNRTPQESREREDWYPKQLKSLHAPSFWELSMKDPAERNILKPGQ
jgi:hypothetical protein